MTFQQQRMEYRHTIIGKNIGEKNVGLSTGKVVCVGRNYAEHAKELNNPVPKSPLFFMKPATSIVSLEDEISLPDSDGSCHFETEIAVLIGESISGLVTEEIQSKIAGFGIGLDLTLRDLQGELKSKGHPWEIAKAFDGACPLSPFVAADKIFHPDQLGLRATVNGSLRQSGYADEMITPILKLIAIISRHFTLLPGDVVMTGTPAGVGPLKVGDELVLELLQKNNNDVDTLAVFSTHVG